MKKSDFTFFRMLKTSVFVIIFVIFITSCGKKEPESPEKNKITFWHFWSEPNQTKILKQIIAEFEKKYDCTIETTELSWNDGKTKLLAAFNSQTAPDVLELGSDWVAQFSSSGVLKEFDRDSLIINHFEDFVLAPSLWEGKIFAIPWVIDTRVLFYNKDLFKKAGLGDAPPKTISDLYKFAEAISNIEGSWGFGVNGSDPHRLYKKILYFMWTLGGGVFDSNGSLIFNSKENANAFELYNQLARVGLIETQREIDAAFTRGKIGLWISGGWLLDKIKNENPDLNFGVAVLPGVTENKPGISFVGGEYLAMNSNTKNSKLANEFIKYMTDGSNSLKFCKEVTEAGFPADKYFFDDEYYKSQPMRSVFAEQLKHGRMTPVNPKWLDIEAQLENAVVEMIYGRKGSMQALEDAQNNIETLLK